VKQHPSVFLGSYGSPFFVASALQTALKLLLEAAARQAGIFFGALE
jgi:hypothetical protein